MNNKPGRHMRYCEHCGVGLGFMTREEFVSSYVDKLGLCPYCGKPVHVVPEESEPGGVNKKG